ncbi:unnamed protein product, partial [Iphiclides podalirius]
MAADCMGALSVAVKRSNSGRRLNDAPGASTFRRQSAVNCREFPREHSKHKRDVRSDASIPWPPLASIVQAGA